MKSNQFVLNNNLIDLKAITISEGAAGMRSQIEGLANLICSTHQNFDIKIKSFFKNLPIQLIPASKYTYVNIDQININDLDKYFETHTEKLYL